MRLAIADPPYLGRAQRNYGPDAAASGFGGGPDHSGRPRQTDGHPNASRWDDPATHQALVNTLSDYDGWAIACPPDSLRHYLQWVPTDTRAFVGAKPAPWTRWVLDMLGYQSGDTVADLFAGSGAVAAEVAQGVLL